MACDVRDVFARRVTCLCAVSAEERHLPAEGAAGADRPPHHGLQDAALHHRLQPQHPAGGEFKPLTNSHRLSPTHQRLTAGGEYNPSPTLTSSHQLTTSILQVISTTLTNSRHLSLTYNQHSACGEYSPHQLSPTYHQHTAGGEYNLHHLTNTHQHTTSILQVVSTIPHQLSPTHQLCVH